MGSRRSALKQSPALSGNTATHTFTFRSLRIFWGTDRHQFAAFRERDDSVPPASAHRFIGRRKHPGKILSFAALPTTDANVSAWVTVFRPAPGDRVRET